MISFYRLILSAFQTEIFKFVVEHGYKYQFDLQLCYDRRGIQESFWLAEVLSLAICATYQVDG